MPEFLTPVLEVVPLWLLVLLLLPWWLRGMMNVAIEGDRYLRSRKTPKVPPPAIGMLFQETPYRFVALEKSGIKKFTDLKGKTVGLQEYDMTAAVVVRGFLRDRHGVDPRDIVWKVGEVERTKPLDFPLGRPPEGVRIEILPPDKSLEHRLLEGELDAVIVRREGSRTGTSNHHARDVSSHAGCAASGPCHDHRPLDPVHRAPRHSSTTRFH